ncbi:MAG: twin-arginine translocase TatA/TatE family subunit [Acidimicrobiales bacterium]|jgi:sec-independent protein translocase protein TatB
MGGLDPAKVLIILLVAIIVLGPERLPKVARQLGSAWRELTKLRERLENEVRSAMPDLDIPKLPTLPTRGISGYLTGMMTSASAGVGTASAGVPADEAAVTTTAFAAGAGAGSDGGIDLLESSRRPGWRPAPETGSGRSPVGTSQWKTSAYEAAPEHSELPAGWHAPGASAPGYASGSILSPVPSAVSSGPLGMEASITFDEPSWN